MNQRKVIIIPATKPEQSGRYLGTPGKIHVAGYARVVKDTGAGVQIRKNIRRIIADFPEWELTFVKTDYRETESQDSTFRSYLSICQDSAPNSVEIENDSSK